MAPKQGRRPLQIPSIQSNGNAPPKLLGVATTKTTVHLTPQTPAGKFNKGFDRTDQPKQMEFSVKSLQPQLSLGEPNRLPTTPSGRGRIRRATVSTNPLPFQNLPYDSKMSDLHNCSYSTLSFLRMTRSDSVLIS